MCTQLSFTLGALTLEQAKHLTAADAGALAGLTSLPSLRTWRERLGELAGTCDPLALQRRLASQMLAIEPAESQVYLADDHIAEYTGCAMRRTAISPAQRAEMRGDYLWI